MNNLQIQAREILSRLSLEQKCVAMSGSTPFWKGLADLLVGGGYEKHTWSGGVLEQPNVPEIHFSDGPRGVVVGVSTTFPVSMARGASWDVDLEERIGEAIGLEARAEGATLYGGVCINLLRHPAWGRAQETYSEDSFLLGEFGVALTKGAQKHLMACVKHFALNSMENARFSVDVKISPRALHEVYLSHFKKTIDAGVASVMSAYNSVNGQWAGHSSELLQGILKDRWGFKGFVTTDWIFGMRDAKLAVLGGQDLEMPFLMHYHTDLLRLVQSGEVSESRIDDAVLRMLEMQLQFAKPPVDKSVKVSHEHIALAREAAEKSIVLLKNGILPLEKTTKLAVIGHLANTINTGDGGSSRTTSPYVVTPLEGIQAAFTHVIFDDGTDLENAMRTAREAETVLLVVGYTKEDEGEFLSPDSTSGLRSLFPAPTTDEDAALAKAVADGLSARLIAEGKFARGGDRSSLRLHPKDEDLIDAVSSVNQNVIVVVVAGSAVLMNAWQDDVSSILMLWYSGMEGGNALANVLLGKVNPSGKLPLSIAEEENHYPFFNAAAISIEYDLWHGYRKLERDGHKAAYPFGFGLSYTTYQYKNLMLEKTDDRLRISLEVHNIGTRDGEEIVQIYVSALNSKVERAKKELKGFARVYVSANRAKLVLLEIMYNDLRYFDEQQDAFVFENLEYEIIAAQHSADPQALRSTIELG
jgi:beta-glucosidase